MKVSVIESVVTITQQRDINALETCLLDELMGMSESIEEIALYAIEDTIEEISCDEICYRNQEGNTLDRVRCGKGIEQSQLLLLKQQPDPILVFNAEGSQCLLVPIMQEDELSAVLQVIAKSIEIELQTMVQALGRIYGNFTRLLIESEKDTLTGLFNRKTFETRLKRLLINQYHNEQSGSFNNANSKERRKGSHADQAWLVMLDIDYFKKVNDDFGHVYGDEVLLIFSQKLRQIFRKNDLLFRFGGEEFVVILEPITYSDAWLAIERFRETIERYEFPQVGHVTVSIGFAKINQEDYPLDVLNLADKALYYAKKNGRNQTFNYEQLVSEKKIKPTELTHGDIELF